jgi:hypothetical protein
MAQESGRNRMCHTRPQTPNTHKIGPAVHLSKISVEQQVEKLTEGRRKVLKEK